MSILTPGRWFFRIQSSALEGVAWKIGFCVCFSVSNGLIKELNLPILEIACLQSLLGGVMLWGGVSSIPWSMFTTPLFWARGGISCLGTLAWVYALHKLPLFQTIALGFIGPLFTAVCARLFLGEILSTPRLLAIILGSIGGLCIMEGSTLWAVWNSVHTGQSLSHCSWNLAVWVPLGATIACSLSNILDKQLLNLKVPPKILASFFLLFIGMVLIPTFPVWICPTWKETGLLFCTAGVLACAHFCMEKAFSCADLTFLIPIGSVKLLLGTWIGIVFFSEVPTCWMYLGSAIILIALVLLSWKQRAKKSRSSPTA